ncbi:hypothetical protein VTN77DRAFT_6066 [Rasamsonia byssochlamydoides]|uniref:uncharacterized protein n=1 Tax=Rasamsonia byssochlamydoides TaxID=89139 RepID=UPI0037446F23
MPLRPSFISRLLQQQVESFRHVSRPVLPTQSKSIAAARFSSFARTARLRTRPGAIVPSKRDPLSKRFYTSQSQPQSEKPSLSQRLKTLSREYGWSALGVYLLLSALDFPFCFLAVRLFGVERIGYYEHVVVEGAKDIFRSVWPGASRRSPNRAEEEGNSHVRKDEAVKPGDGHGVLEAEKKNSGEGASILTQLALAYAIHKSFIFIRVPLTAAVTPKVVKTLRRWGWDIGKRSPKSS